MWAANTVRRYSRLSWGLDKSFKPAYDYSVGQIPKGLRVVIPEGYGDGGLIGDFDEACPSRAPHWQEGWSYRSIKTFATFQPVNGPSQIDKSLYQLEKGAEEPDVRVPKSSKWRFAPSVCARWPSYGPWL